MKISGKKIVKIPKSALSISENVENVRFSNKIVLFLFGDINIWVCSPFMSHNSMRMLDILTTLKYLCFPLLIRPVMGKITFTALTVQEVFNEGYSDATLEYHCSLL